MKTKALSIWNWIKTASPFLLILVVIFFFRECEGRQQDSNRYQENKQALESEVREVNLSNGELAHEKDLLKVTKEELEKQVWIKDDTIKALLKKLKDPKVVIKWKTKLEYKDTLLISFDSPVDYKFNKSFSRNTEWYSVSGIVTQNGVSFNDILIPNTQRLVVAYKRGKPIVSITNSNPFIRSEEIQGQIIEIPKRRFVVAAGVGWNYFQDPYFGIFTGYKLFQF